MYIYRAPDKVLIFITKMSISWPNPTFDHLLESSHRDDSNKWSNIGFCQEIKELASIEIHFTHLIWRSDILFQVFYVVLLFYSPFPMAVEMQRKATAASLQWETWQRFAIDCPEKFSLPNNGPLETPSSINCLQIPPEWVLCNTFWQSYLPLWT